MRFEVFTRNRFRTVYVMPKSSQTKGIYHFVLLSIAKSTSLFTWTDDEVELLLKVTNEYKIRKTAEGIDWESVKRKYSDILDRFREEKQM